MQTGEWMAADCNLVAQAGQVMGKIVNSIKHATDIMPEIAAVSVAESLEEQAQKFSVPVEVFNVGDACGSTHGAHRPLSPGAAPVSAAIAAIRAQGGGSNCGSQRHRWGWTSGRYSEGKGWKWRMGRFLTSYAILASGLLALFASLAEWLCRANPQLNAEKRFVRQLHQNA